VAKIVSLICQQRYTDVFAGFKSWKADAIRNLNLQEDGFTYEAEIAIKAHKKGYKIIEVPTGYKKRITGESKIKFLYHSFSVATRIIKITFSE
jgi:dolichol-phosphate mannosyltransferase